MEANTPRQKLLGHSKNKIGIQKHIYVFMSAALGQANYAELRCRVYRPL